MSSYFVTRFEHVKMAEKESEIKKENFGVTGKGRSKGWIARGVADRIESTFLWLLEVKFLLNTSMSVYSLQKANRRPPNSN